MSSKIRIIIWKGCIKFALFVRFFPEVHVWCMNNFKKKYQDKYINILQSELESVIVLKCWWIFFLKSQLNLLITTNHAYVPLRLQPKPKPKSTSMFTCLFTICVLLPYIKRIQFKHRYIFFDWKVRYLKPIVVLHIKKILCFLIIMKIIQKTSCVFLWLFSYLNQTSTMN